MTLNIGLNKRGRALVGFIVGLMCWGIFIFICYYYPQDWHIGVIILLMMIMLSYVILSLSVWRGYQEWKTSSPTSLPDCVTNIKAPSVFRKAWAIATVLPWLAAFVYLFIG